MFHTVLVVFLTAVCIAGVTWVRTMPEPDDTD